MNKENLRKVIYQRNGSFNMFEAGFEDEKEAIYIKDMLEHRSGWFHQWLEGKNIALIENENGEIEEIESRYIKFVE